MMRVLAVFVLAWGATAVASQAAEVKGMIKSVDADAKTLTITVGADDKAYRVADDARIVKITGKEDKLKFEKIPGGLKGLAPGNQVTAFTESTAGDRLTEIRVSQRKKKQK
jgi:hypothetical protein